MFSYKYIYIHIYIYIEREGDREKERERERAFYSEFGADWVGNISEYVKYVIFPKFTTPWMFQVPENSTKVRQNLKL